MFKQLRILFALLILLFVAVSTTLTRYRSTDWNDSLWVYIYPVNGDLTTKTANYIRSLNERSFHDIERFMAREALRYRDIKEKPIQITVAPEVTEKPPMPPYGGNFLQVAYWSMTMRYWAWTHNSHTGPKPDIQIYVVYYDPDIYDSVGHSFGLQKGLVGVINAYASRRDSKRNNVIIAHELLHTLGATDKYDLSNNQPVYPIGYADPDKVPRYPQSRAELMGGRIPLSPRKAEQPDHLRQVIIGPLTALEIRLTE